MNVIKLERDDQDCLFNPNGETPVLRNIRGLRECLLPDRRSKDGGEVFSSEVGMEVEMWAYRHLNSAGIVPLGDVDVYYDFREAGFVGSGSGRQVRFVYQMYISEEGHNQVFGLNKK